MEENAVYSDTTDRLLRLARDTLGDTFKAYYEGDPIFIPKNNYPCVIVEKVKGNVKLGPTGADRIGEQITIRLVMNKKDDFDKSDDYDQAERRLRRYVEARDPATSWFLPDTMMYALRTNITLGNTLLDEDVDIDYDLQPRPNQQVSCEAKITIVTRSNVTVPNRT